MKEEDVCVRACVRVCVCVCVCVFVWWWWWWAHLCVCIAPANLPAGTSVHLLPGRPPYVMAFRQQTPRSACVERVHGAGVTLALAIAAAAAFQCGVATAAAAATSACPTAGAEKMVVVTTAAGGSYYSWPECAGAGTTFEPINATAQQGADDEAASVAKQLADAQASFDNRTAAYKAKCDADPTVAECAAIKSEVDSLAAELVILQAALDKLKGATVTKL